MKSLKQYRLTTSDPSYTGNWPRSSTGRLREQQQQPTLIKPPMEDAFLSGLDLTDVTLWNHRCCSRLISSLDRGIKPHFYLVLAKISVRWSVSSLIYRPVRDLIWPLLSPHSQKVFMHLPRVILHTPNELATMSLELFNMGFNSRLVMQCHPTAWRLRSMPTEVDAWMQGHASLHIWIRIRYQRAPLFSRSKRQPIVALSSGEAEYISLSACAKEVTLLIDSCSKPSVNNNGKKSS